MYTLYFDGASRLNPGESGCGMVLYDSNNQELCNNSIYIGKTTNNVAEYYALLFGIKMCISKNISYLKVKGDSLLVIKQMKKEWKCKAEHLKNIKNMIDYQIKISNMQIEYEYIPRNKNKRADELANQAINIKNIYEDINQLTLEVTNPNNSILKKKQRFYALGFENVKDLYCDVSIIVEEKEQIYDITYKYCYSSHNQSKYAHPFYDKPLLYEKNSKGEIIHKNMMTREMINLLLLDDQELQKYIGNATPNHYRKVIMHSIALLWD